MFGFMVVICSYNELVRLGYKPTYNVWGLHFVASGHQMWLAEKFPKYLFAAFEGSSISL